MANSRRREWWSSRLEQTPDEAAVHSDRGTRDVAGALRSEKSHDRGKLLRSAEAPHRDFTFPARKDFFRLRARARGNGGSQAVEASGARVARANVVHGNAVGSVFIGERTSQTRDRSAHGIGKEQTVNGLLYGRRSDGNHTPPLVFLHARQSFPGEKNGAHQKLFDSGAPIFRFGVLKGVGRRTAGIGNTNIEASETGLDGSHKDSNCRRISDIEGLMEDLAAGGFGDV